MRDDDSLSWITLGRAPGLDAGLVSAALEVCGSPGAVLAAGTGRSARAVLPAVTCDYLSSAAGRALTAEHRWLESAHHHIVAFTHPRYPDMLRALPSRPIALYVSGSLAAISEPQLAVVGTRHPTAQASETAFEFAQYFGLRGLGITSGLAEGIDGSAHRGALQARGITLAVLGTGIDQVYPRSHRALADDITCQGALLSEFPLGSPPLRHHFPQRNRLIAGLSLGTLVVEAARRSGSLITARWANDLGREVFAIPGSIHNPLSRGCHELIKSGAKLVETAHDILSELNFSAFFANDLPKPADAPAPGPGTAGMDKDHKILLDALGFDPVDLDRLVVRTGFKPEAVSSMMLILELEGHVQAAPGGRYARVAHRRAGGER